MWPALISAGAGLFSAWQAKKGQERTNEQNIEQSQENRDFQERMSSTAHQREVNDLRAAGLNPLLSLNSGASTPSGSFGTAENPVRDVPNHLANSARVAMEMKINNATLEKIKADTRLTNSTSAKVEAETPRNTLTGKVSGKILEGLGYGADFIAHSARKLGEKSARLEMALARKN